MIVTRPRDGPVSPDSEPRALLVADTSVLVNLAILDRLDLFAATGFEAHVPNHVVQEVLRREQRERLQRAFAAGQLTELEISDIAEMTEYAALRKRFGDGESAAMAVAFARRWTVAVDEAGPVRRIVLERLGPALLLTTPALLTRSVRLGVISKEDVPGIRATLAANRYVMGPLEVERE
jgi:predicted nucleic acid-binding protein